MDQGHGRIRINFSQPPVDECGALGAGGKWAGGVHAMNVAECASISRFEYFVIKIIEQ
jgi:hypothetical protein